MKIAISSKGTDLESEVDQKFGRCSYFLIVNPDDMTFEAFKNESVPPPCTGITSAQFVASKGANVIITGKAGPEAEQTAKELGLDMITGISGSIREAVERYKKA